MRLGATGLSIADYIDAVDDEILRDDVGMIYYKNKEGHIISIGKAARTSIIVDYILDKFEVDSYNVETNIYLFPGHPINLENTITSKLKVSTEELNGAKCVLICDTLSSNSEDDLSDSTMDINRDISLSFDNGSTLDITSNTMIDLTAYTSSLSQTNITITDVNSVEGYKYEYLVGVYLLIVKGV